MNITDIKLRVFEVTVTKPSIVDAYGEHIGDNLPTDGPGLFTKFRDKLHVAGYSMTQVANLLSIHKIQAINIKDLDILLNATGNSL